MADLRVGLVGAGGVGQRHAQTLARLPEVRLVAVTDVDAPRAEELARGPDAPPPPPAEAPLPPSRLAPAGRAAVWVCLPPFAHGATERRVLEAGLPFFVEKPLAVDLATAQDV